jgi:hypothetical protein
VPDNRYPLMINGVAVVSAPVEIDIANAEQLRAVLLEAGRRGHGTVVVDMTRTRYCDSAGVSALVAAHCGPSRNSPGLRSRNSPGPGLCLFYLMSSFGVGVTRPGLLLGR